MRRYLARWPWAAAMGAICTAWAAESSAGTTQAACNANVYISADASGGTGSMVFGASAEAMG